MRVADVRRLRRFLIGACVSSLSALVGAGGETQQRGAGPQSTQPPIPYEVDNACPFEGCEYREWIANAHVDVRTGRRANDRIAFTLERGDRVQAVKGVLATVKPGRVQFKSPVDLDSATGRIHVEPGETVYILAYQGEGEATAWFKGRSYDRLDGAEFFDARCEGASSACRGWVAEWPERQWWVQLRSSRGVIGWTRDTDKFDNKGVLHR